MTLRLLPLITGLLPVFTIHASYLIAVQAQRVPACIPYLDGCTSVSATGRYLPASLLFKPAMLIGAILLFAFWVCTSHWLRLLEQRHAATARVQPARLALMGGAGATALVLYITFLGTSEPFYEFMRRFGIYLFFLLTILSQLDMSIRLGRVGKFARDNHLSTLARRLLTLAIFPFALGALNLVLKAVLADPDGPENIIEWIVVLMIQAHIALTYFAWRHTGFTVQFALPPLRD